MSVSFVKKPCQMSVSFVKKKKILGKKAQQNVGLFGKKKKSFEKKSPGGKCQIWGKK